MVWASKTKYFVLAACLILVASVLAFARTLVDRASYTSKSAQREKIKLVVDEAQKTQSDLKAEEAKGADYEAVVKKEMELFKYRDMIPLLYQKLIATLPNDRSNPEQAELYRAFNTGDAAAMKEKYPDRRERKQIFVTGMSIYYTLDVASGQFGSMGFEKGADSRENMGEGMGRMPSRGDIDMMRGRGGMGGRGGVMDIRSVRGRGMQMRAGAQADESLPRGFVITISGYSPYKAITELLDPAKVQDDPNKWGLVTRLMHLDSMFDGNSPFELYKKTDKQHFDLQIGDVDTTASIPAGTGTRKTIEGQGEVIVDPMTNEVISKITEDAPGGKKVAKVNDSWFVLNFKLQWKDKTAAPAEGAGTPGAVPPGMQPPADGRGEAPPPPPPPASPPGGKDGEL
jgi:hypothetical protein